MKNIMNRLGIQPNQDPASIMQILKSRKIDTMQELCTATKDPARTQDLYGLLNDIEKLISNLEKEIPIQQGNTKHKIDSFKKNYADYANNLHSDEGPGFNDTEESMKAANPVESDPMKTMNSTRGSRGINTIAVTRSLELFNEQIASAETKTPKTQNSLNSIKPIDIESKNIGFSDAGQEQSNKVMQQGAAQGKHSFGSSQKHNREEKELNDLEAVELQKNLINIEELIQLEEIMKKEEGAKAKKTQEVSQEANRMMEKLNDLFSNDLARVTGFPQEAQNIDKVNETLDKHAVRGLVTNTTVSDTTKRVAKIYQFDDKRESSASEHYGVQDKHDIKKSMASWQGVSRQGVSGNGVSGKAEQGENKAKEIETMMTFGNTFWQCQNYSRALDYYRKAADLGHGQAFKGLGDAYYYGLGTEQDYETALSWYDKAAEQGSLEAQSYIGECYYYGKGVTQDYKKALEWYWKAALQGEAFAQKRFADCCYSGKGTIQDFAQALQWYSKAAEQGYISAYKGLGDCYFYGRGIKQDYAEAVVNYTQAASKGDIDAQINLSGCYYYGDGVEQNYPLAVHWLQKAASQGSAIAQINLANCYSQGLGVSQDYQEAVLWYKEAAKQGDALAQMNLGNCYYFGEGVSQNYTEAVKWLEKAADQGNSDAQYNLGSCYYYGHGVAQDWQNAMRWYGKAAGQGNTMAQEILKNQGFVERN